MKKKEIKVVAPEGFHFTGEVTNTEEGNTIAVVFEEDEPKEITWEEIFNSNIVRKLDAHTLKIAKLDYYTSNAFLESIKNSHNYSIAYIRLRVIAAYLNGDWKPKVNEYENIDDGYVIQYTPNTHIAEPWCCCGLRAGIVLFKDKQSCEEAIRIMGNELKYLFNY